MNGSKGENSSHRVFYRFAVAPEDDDPKRMIEYLYGSFERKYDATPATFVGTLEDAVYAALRVWVREGVGEGEGVKMGK